MSLTPEQMRDALREMCDPGGTAHGAYSVSRINCGKCGPAFLAEWAEQIRQEERGWLEQRIVGMMETHEAGDIAEYNMPLRPLLAAIRNRETPEPECNGKCVWTQYAKPKGLNAPDLPHTDCPKHGGEPTREETPEPECNGNCCEMPCNDPKHMDPDCPKCGEPTREGGGEPKRIWWAPRRYL